MIMLGFILLFLAVTLIPTVVILTIINNKQQKKLQQLQKQVQMFQQLGNQGIQPMQPMPPNPGIQTMQPVPPNSGRKQTQSINSNMVRQQTQPMNQFTGRQQAQTNTQYPDRQLMQPSLQPASYDPAQHRMQGNGQISDMAFRNQTPVPGQPLAEGGMQKNLDSYHSMNGNLSGNGGWQENQTAFGGQNGNGYPKHQVHVTAKEIKHGFGVVNLTLILGVLFILVSGLIFSTSTWDFIPDIFKMVLILSLSGVFFLASVLAERIFQLKHTSVAFYLLGCLFIPVVFLSIGYFNLLGPWFSLDGDGRYFLCFLTSLSFEGSILLGFLHYRLTFFKWTAWAASLGILGYFVRIFTDSQALIWTVLNSYILAVMTWKFMKGKYQWLAYLHPLALCMVLVFGFETVIPEVEDRGLAWSIVLAVAFLIYCIGKLPEGRRLRTYVSDYFLSFVMIVRGMISLALGNFVWSLCSVLLAAGCLLFITVWYKKKETDCLNAWLTCALLVLSLFPLWNYCLKTGGWVYEAGIISYYALFSAVGIFCYYKRKVISGFAVLSIPANIFWGIAGIVQMAGCYMLGLKCWILFWWILTLCYAVQRRRQTYYVLTVVGLLLLPVLTVYSVKPGYSAILYWLFTGATACFFYLFYLWKIKQENQAVWKIQMIRWVGVIGFYTSVILSLMLYLGERQWSAVYGLVLMALILIGNWIGFKEKNTVLALPINLPIRSLAVVTLGKMVHISKDQHLWAGLVVCIGMMCAGQLLYHRLYDITPPKEHKAGHYYLDSFSFPACLIPFTMLIGYGDYWRFWGLVLLMICLLNGYQRLEPFMDQWILTAVTAVGYVAFRLEPYVVIPKEWVTEYCLILILLAGLSLGLIWKAHTKTVGGIRFGIAVYAVLRQGFDCLYYARIWDALVLGTAMVLVLWLAYYWRKKRWLLLSASTLFVLVVYCSRSLWMSIAWWVYLLIAGIVMILTAGFNEYSRKSGTDVRKKIKGTFSQWTW